MLKNLKKIKVVNAEEENIHFFLTTWGISMNISGKIWLTIVLKFTINQGFTFSLTLPPRKFQKIVLK